MVLNIKTVNGVIPSIKIMRCFEAAGITTVSRCPLFIYIVNWIVFPIGTDCARVV